MTYIRFIEEDRAQGDLRELYDRIGGARGGVADVMKVQSLNPPAMMAHFELYKTLMFGRSELDRRTREMIGVVVSAANECPYCVEHHTQPLRAYKIDEDLLEALGDGVIPRDELARPLWMLLDFVRDLTLNPRSDEARVEALTEIGWSDNAILDATMIAGYFNFVNRVALGLGVELEADYDKTCDPELRE